MDVWNDSSEREPRLVAVLVAKWYDGHEGVMVMVAAAVALVRPMALVLAIL